MEDNWRKQPRLKPQSTDPSMEGTSHFIFSMRECRCMCMRTPCTVWSDLLEHLCCWPVMTKRMVLLSMLLIHLVCPMATLAVPLERPNKMPKQKLKNCDYPLSPWNSLQRRQPELSMLFTMN
uniref:Uncharacterized protein n=1 Tax=Cacopsylla melanoneura TaxID=428564 RepID=A0A8D8SPL8_9HEMI